MIDQRFNHYRRSRRAGSSSPADIWESLMDVVRDVDESSDYEDRLSVVDIITFAEALAESLGFEPGELEAEVDRVAAEVVCHG